MTAINQKEYLKKYLSIGSEPGKKKKKKKKLAVSDRVKIIDDDIDVATFNQAVEEDLHGLNEDAPQIVGIIDDRPLELRIDDYRKSDLWKPLNSQDNNADTNMDTSVRRRTSTSYSPRRKRGNSSDSDSPKNSSHSDGKRKRSDDISPIRRRRNSDVSPPRRSRKDSDRSPVRKNRDSDINQSKKNTRDNNISPNRSSRRYSDSSPPRKATTRGDDISPIRKTRRDSDTSPVRRSTKDRDPSPIRRNRRNSDITPPRRYDRGGDRNSMKNDRRHDSPRRYRYNNDERYRGGQNTSRYDDRRYRERDTNRRNDDRTKRYHNESPPRKSKYHRDESPQRRDGRDHNREYRNDSKEKSASSKSSNMPRKSRWDDDNEVKALLEDNPIVKMYQARKSGLKRANEFMLQNEFFQKNEEFLPSTATTAEASTANAAPIVRDRKTGKIRDFEKEAEEAQKKQEKDDELKAKYDRWGRGLKQVEDATEKLNSDLQEMNKPLARYADDEDLEKHLKEVERDGDPMLAYLRKKRKKTDIEAGKPVKPQFDGEFMPNRYGIRPGHRWDGVDRSNGYEKKWFEVMNSRRAQQEESYKWSTEDM